MYLIKKKEGIQGDSNPHPYSRESTVIPVMPPINVNSSQTFIFLPITYRVYYSATLHFVTRTTYHLIEGL